MGVAHLFVVDDEAENGRRSAALEMSGHERRVLNYWSQDSRFSGNGNADCFLLAFLLTVMESGNSLIVHGSVSETLLGHLEELQLIWHKWRPERYQRFDIEANNFISGPRQGKRAIAAFSGGVDAAFTMFRHVHGVARYSRVDLSAALMVHGVDIALSEEKSFANMVDRGRLMLKDTDVELITVATDFKSLYQNWPDAFGLAIASCLLLYQDEYQVGLIGSSEDYGSLALPYGSSPVTDHLYSTHQMTLRHEGAGYSRLEKIEEMLGHPEIISNLRVCWTGAENDQNCGVCFKCMATLALFKIATDEHPSCFPYLLTAGLVSSLKVWNATQLAALKDVLSLAKTRRINDHWVVAWQEAITRNETSSADDSLWRRNSLTSA